MRPPAGAVQPPPALCSPQSFPMPPAQGAAHSQCQGYIVPPHMSHLQGRNNGHHTDSALGRAHPTPKGTDSSQHRASQNPPVVPQTPLWCPAPWCPAPRCQPGLNMLGRCPGATTLSSAMPPAGSLHPCADGQHRPIPPGLPTQHGRWVLSLAWGSPALPRHGKEGGREVSLSHQPHLISSFPRENCGVLCPPGTLGRGAQLRARDWPWHRQLPLRP